MDVYFVGFCPRIGLDVPGTSLCPYVIALDCRVSWDLNWWAIHEVPLCRDTSLIRNSTLLGPYRRTVSRALWWP